MLLQLELDMMNGLTVVAFLFCTSFSDKNNCLINSILDILDINCSKLNVNFWVSF